MGNLRTILVLCVVTISLLSYSVCAKKSSKSKRKSSVKHHKEGKLARLISKVDRQLGGKKNISYIVNPLKYSNYVEQFKKIRNLGEEVRCKLRGSCAEDLKRFQITHGGARHFRIKNKVGQKKSMQSFSSVNMPDTSNQVIQQDRLMSTEGPNPSQFMNSAYSNQPNAADFGQQPQMNIQLPKTPESVPMSPQGIPTMDQMQNAANDASIQNSIQSKMNFMDSANGQMMPFGPGPAGGMGGPGGPGGGMGMDGMRSSGHGHAKFVRHHGPMKGHIMDDMPGRESSHMNEEEEQNMHDDHHHHDHPSSEPSRFSDDNNKDEEEDSEDEKNDHPSNKSSSSRFHADNNRDDERDPKEMHEMHEMPNNREFSSMNDESKDEAERMRMSDGPRGVPNTDTASVSDEDIYKAEGVQPNEMKDLHNFLSHNHKYKPKDEEEESIRENEEFNENERRHGANVATSNDREDKDYRGDSRSPDKDDRSEEEEEHTGHHSHGSRNEPDEDLEDKHHSSHHHHGGHEHGHGGVGEPVGHAIGGPMGAEPGMGPPPGIGMGMGMGGPGAMGAGMGPVAGMGMGPDVGMGGPPGMGPGASMPGAGMEGMGPGVGMAKPGGVEVPTLNNLMGGGVPLTGMADDTLGGPPGRPNVDFDNQGRFVSDNQRSMMESNSDYDVPKTAFASLWKDYMLTTQSQLADRDPSANNRGHIHHPHHGKKFKVRKTGKELHRWKKSYVEDDEPGSKRSDAPAAPIPNNTTAPQSNVTMDNATQTTAQISNTTTTSNKTAAEAATPTIDQSNSTTLTNNNTIDSPQNKTVESTKNETKPAKKSDVKNKPDTLPPIYLTIKNGEKLLVVHPTAEFINSLPKINFTEEEDAVKRTKIDNEIPTYISPLRSHEPDENESDEDNDDEDDDEDDEGGETKSNIVARSNIFTKTGNNKGFISVPVISPDPNGKIGLMLNTARDKVYSEGETKPIQRSFGDQGNNFGTPLGGQGGERRDGHNFSPEYNQQIQNVPNQFDQSSSPSATHKGFYKTQPDESMPMIPKDIQTLYRQYQPGDGKNSFQYAPSQDEVREELNYVEHKNENTNDREDGGMSPFMSQQDPQMSAENDYNNRIAEPNSAPINPNRDSPSQWDQGDQHMSDGSRRSDVPIVFTKEHVGFGPITVEAKTADAPPDDPALDE